MENQTITAGATPAPVNNQPTDGAPNPFKKVILALTALLVVGGVGAGVYLNMGTPAQGDPNEPPPSLSAAGGLKGSFVESLQGFLQYEAKDVVAFDAGKAALATKFGAPGVVKGNAAVNYMTVNADGMTMADFVNNNSPVADKNLSLFLIYSAGQGGLSKGFHSYPVGPFGAATKEIKKDDLSKITLARNSGVVMISKSNGENYGVLDPSVAPTSSVFPTPLLPDDKSGWVLVSGNGKLLDLLGTNKDRVISAWGLKDPTTFEKVDLNTYAFSTYHVAWVNLLPKSAVTDPTPTAVAPKITSVTPKTAEQGQKAVTFIVTGTDLGGAKVEFSPAADFQNITGLTVDTTSTSVKFIADIADVATVDFKEIKVTTAKGSVTDKSFKVTAKAAPAGTITAKTSTDEPSAIVFTAPTEKQTFTADVLKVNGLSFSGTDSNKTSYNKDAAGNFYMNYAWSLTAAGATTPTWSTGWTYDAAKISYDAAKIATCVTTLVTATPVAPYMTCPSGTIPKSFFADIKSGDYTLAGTVGDGKASKTTNVTITVTGSVQVPAAGTAVIGSEVLALAPSVDGPAGYPGTYNGSEYQWVKGKIQNIGSLYDVVLSEGAKTGKLVYLGKAHVAALATPTAPLVVGQKVISKGNPDTDGTFWSATITKVDGANYTFTYDHNITIQVSPRTISNFFVPLSGVTIVTPPSTALSITSTTATPSSLAAGETSALLIKGLNLLGATLSGKDLTFSIPVIDTVQNLMSVTVTVNAGAAAGKRNITITTATGTYLWENALTITVPDANDGWKATLIE